MSSNGRVRVSVVLDAGQIFVLLFVKIGANTKVLRRFAQDIMGSTLLEP